ncbi:hypothetical protein FVQ98_04225 [Ottowia sp. GY511]|uniref:Hedgehog/Intein (Hint) domain-containing protein n=1 Tax=Ottowia flava TaxID=2675430 RepID=A0ABW4KW32_9BURK|nr:hypothetical protein [Ottowia sp. GY511]TXK31195.1 hypothetical protein FVQ98_04225 [Ottowia sp. GY511]
MNPSAEPTPVFPLLEQVSPDRFSGPMRAMETGPLALLPPGMVVTQRHCYLAKHGTWVAYVQQAEQAARAWQGVRQPIPGRRVGLDLLEWWRSASGDRAEALTMTTQPVDELGHYLLGYFRLAERKG